ncbi:cell wall-binding repeat-containing protein [Stomatohabitans albus]|uniref:cell wall-binding repeat-containing protein n=1 Tax=Stomatohabitans albus TaxID=3110766 RepID=UPI00300D43F2
MKHSVRVLCSGAVLLGLLFSGSPSIGEGNTTVPVDPSSSAPSATPSNPTETPGGQAGSVTIDIKRLSGNDRYGTAIAITKHLYKDHEAKDVILASGEQFPDAITAANFFKTKQAMPLLLTPAAVLTKEVKDELTRLAATKARVIVIGGEKAINASVVDELTGMGLQPARLAGPDRQSTSVAIANQTRGRGQSGLAVVTPADDFALGVFGASLATHSDANHLIAFNQVPLQTSVKDYFLQRKTRQAIVLGDAFDFSLPKTSFEVIRSNNPEAVPTVVCYPNSNCVGSTDFEPPASGQQTVVENMLVKHFNEATNIVMVASDKPVDGIAATQLAAQLDAPILPIEPKFVHRYLGVIKQLGKKDRNFYLIGGEEAIGEQIAGQINRVMKD